MDVITSLDALAARDRVVAIGTFDGVHVGHQAVIGRATALAAQRGLASTVLTFDRHPLSVIAPRHAPRLLTPLAEKVRLIGELGPDELVLLPFTRETAALDAADFCEHLLRDVLHARHVVVGDNFTFGARGAGDTGTLRACGEACGFETEVLELVTGHGVPISSTRIRALLSAGELEEVREILGRPPSARGQVVPGFRRGRTLGVPTANVDVEADSLFPGRGVYAARARVRGAWYRAAVNIGHNPTFQSPDAETTHVSIEAFLLGFAGDIYDCEIRVDFLHKLRGERRFESVDALVAQMQRDIATTARLADPAYDEAGLAPSAGR